MVLPRMRSPRGSTRRRIALWSALAMGSILPSVGCQVEYAGMTLPSGRYMHDDVQYFASSPDFPWANSQAATQRARMRAMGIEPPEVGVAPVGGGALDPTQGQLQTGGRMTNPNVQPQLIPPGAGGLPGAAVPGAPQPGGVPAVPAPALRRRPGSSASRRRCTAPGRQQSTIIRAARSPDRTAIARTNNENNEIDSSIGRRRSRFVVFRSLSRTNRRGERNQSAFGINLYHKGGKIPDEGGSVAGAK